MIALRITDNVKDIRQWTGLPSDNDDEALQKAGFDLGDLAVCIESDTRLKPHSEAWWLVERMASYGCAYFEVEYNGKWYYTVHHDWFRSTSRMAGEDEEKMTQSNLFDIEQPNLTAFGESPAGQLELMRGFYLSAKKKPCIWHRFWMRVLLGWKWHDGNVIAENRE